jgi:A/G-specific adenine glycosylase
VPDPAAQRSIAGRLDPATRRRLNRALLAWQARCGRRLAVRDATTPWSILVAEVMSQQTQIGRIGPAWTRFVGRWPTPAGLAGAPTQDVLIAWAGLGYNRRALALREAARTIVEYHGGQVPSSVADLEALPGIGPYTARSVAAIAFGTPVAPLDVNVRRVVGRLTGAPSPAGLQATADGLVARDDPRRWVEAVMDLAATVCTARAPACAGCPVRAWCRSRDAPGAPVPRGPAGAPFSSTNRWLRGRLLATFRDAPPGTWLEPPGSVGSHGPERVAAALDGLARDGFIELAGGRARIRS